MGSTIMSLGRPLTQRGPLCCRTAFTLHPRPKKRSVPPELRLLAITYTTPRSTNAVVDQPDALSRGKRTHHAGCVSPSSDLRSWVWVGNLTS